MDALGRIGAAQDVDLSELGSTSPVYGSFDANLTESPGQVAESLGELFTHWTALIEAGIEFFDEWWTSIEMNYPAYPIDGPPT